MLAAVDMRGTEVMVGACFWRRQQEGVGGPPEPRGGQSKSKCGEAHRHPVQHGTSCRRTGLGNLDPKGSSRIVLLQLGSSAHGQLTR